MSRTRLCRDSQLPRAGPAATPPSRGLGTSWGGGGGSGGREPRGSWRGWGGCVSCRTPCLLGDRVKVRSLVPLGEPGPASPALRPRGWARSPKEGERGGGVMAGGAEEGKLLDGKMPGLTLDAGSRDLCPPRSHIQSPPAWCPGHPRPKGSASDVPQFPFSPVI